MGLLISLDLTRRKGLSLLKPLKPFGHEKFFYRRYSYLIGFNAISRVGANLFESEIVIQFTITISAGKGC